MWYEGLFMQLEKMQNDEQAEKMSAYMQNRFPFLGLPKPELSKIIKPYIKEARKLPIDWDFVDKCWEKPYREAQYTGIEYICSMKKAITEQDLDKVKRLITDKSWWETVDSLDAIVGEIVEKNDSLKKTMLEWSLSENIWLRRTAIDFQQEYKEKTDTELFSKIILNNVGSKEFFINKAIGWSLRDYSKVNPDWVRSFVDSNKDKLDKLSIKEASKYI